MTIEAPDRVRVDYEPTARQALAHATAVDELLYGGAAGGGKSRFARMEALAFALEVPGSATLILRKTFPDLNRAGGMIPQLRIEVPRPLGTYNATDHIWTLRNGSTIELGYLRSDADVGNYQGAEYQLIIIDEATQQTEFRIAYLRSRLRASGPIKDRLEALGYAPRMILTANPGGPAHAYIKARFIDPAPPEVAWRPTATLEEPRPGVRCFIPAKVTDNPHIDAGYEDRLNTLPEEERRALRDGDWDVYAGQRFKDFRRAVHVIDPEDLPLGIGGVTRAVGVDYGLDAPFAALWGAKLADGLIVVYREVYAPGLTADEQADAILTAEAPGERGNGRPVPVALDPSTWARSPHHKAAPKAPGNLRAGGDDDDVPPPGSIADTYRARFGGQLVKAYNNRLDGVAMVAGKLRVRPDGLPRLLIYSTCRNLIRTLPALPRDQRRPEDVDTTAEDHCLAGDTLVDTINGPARIADLVGTSGHVYGLDGVPVPYFDVRLMRAAAELIRVTLEDGRSVTCTADHKLATPGGWRHAADLRPTDTMLCATVEAWTPSSSATPSRSTPAAATTSAAPTSSTATSDSTDACGPTTTAPSPTGITSTTTTTTPPTTGPPTSSYAPSSITCPTTAPTPATPPAQLARRMPASTQPPVTPSSPPSSAPTPRPVDGRTSSGPRSDARSAAPGSRLRSRAAHAIAAGHARPARVVDVSPAGSGDVYDLAVEHPDHLFTVNGGLMVSNCYDALRYLVAELERRHAGGSGGGPLDPGVPLPEAPRVDLTATTSDVGRRGF